MTALPVPTPRSSDPKTVARTAPLAYLPQLDGVRGMAILLVMLHHGGGITAQSSLHSVYARVAQCGWVGVDLFFVLSGFLITRGLIADRDSSTYYSAFYARRTLRIFPLYFAFLAVVLFVLPEPFGARLPPHQAVWYWTYLSNVLAALSGDFGPISLGITWSLAIEEQFYLLWPWLVRRAGSPTSLARWCCGLMAAAFVSRVVLCVAGVTAVANYTLLVTRMDTLAAGALVAVLVHEGATSWQLALRRWTPAAGIVAAAALLGGRDPHAPLSQLLGYGAIAVFCAGVVLHAVVNPGSTLVRLLWNNAALRWVGTHSYGMYLLHRPVQLGVNDAIGASIKTSVGEPLLAQLTLLSISTAATALAAWGVYHVLEKHFLALKPRFSR